MSKVASHSFPWLQIHRVSKFALTCFPVQWFKCNTAVVEPVPCCSCGRHIQPSWHEGDFHQNCYSIYNHELLALVNQNCGFVRKKNFLVHYESILCDIVNPGQMKSLLWFNSQLACWFIRCPFDVVFYQPRCNCSSDCCSVIKSANLLKFTSAEGTLILWQKVVFQQSNLAR